jgi:hypothetical protein
MSYANETEKNFSSGPDLYTTKNLLRVGVAAAIGIVVNQYWPETQKDQAFLDAIAAEAEMTKKQLPS